MSSSVLFCVITQSHKAVSPAHGDGSVSDFGLRMERPGPESESEEDVTSDQGGGHTTLNTWYPVGLSITQQSSRLNTSIKLSLSDFLEMISSCLYWLNKQIIRVLSDYLYLESSTSCIKLSISCLKVVVVEMPMWPRPSSSHVTMSMLLFPPSLASWI